MKNSFLRFFTGKMEKSVYVATVSVVVCLATVVGSVAIAHSQNKKIDTALESLAQAESTAETVTESVAESVSVSDKETNESNGDKALQYLAEYNKLTSEYEKKKAELEKQIYDVQKREVILQSAGEEPPISMEYPGSTNVADYPKYKADFDKSISENHSVWVERSRLYEEAYQYQSRIAETEYASEKAKVDDAKRKLTALDAQYEKDVATLKAKYGIE